MSRSLGIGLIGGVTGSVIGMPLAWMLGPMLAAIVVSLAGVRMMIPTTLGKVFKAVIGIMLGTAITPETLERIIEWPVSIALVAAGVLSVAALVSIYYQRIGNFDRLTAVAASLPGAISSIPPMAISMGADPQRTILPQLLRVAMIVVLVPPLYLAWQGEPAVASETSLLSMLPTRAFWLGEGLWILLFAPLGWSIGRLIRLPVPQLLGPMIIAAGFTLAGFSIVIPPWLFAMTFLVLGTSIGARFYQMPIGTLFGTGRHALFGTLLTFAGIGGVGVIIHTVTGAPLPVALLAVTPGGIAEMALLATALGVDPVFVTFHQVTRAILLNFLAPFIFAWIQGRSWRG